MTDSSDAYWLRVEEIFHDALDLPEEERSAFISKRCAGDAALKREVEDILKNYAAQDSVSSTAADAAPDRARFGAFEIVSKIGEGGMGAVYLGRRCEDFEQRAAIKLINGGPGAMVLMASRFREERQILAALEHPNIARLLDGGVTLGGQPYLVMEYVAGVRLDEYCESRRLTIRQRIELFRKLCEAVHFAHRHLVIHRDLKPGNILVDEQGEPKLLDFGIAKVLTAPENSLEHTFTGGLLLTPGHASPEQIQGQPCTVSTDIYSLGVILYEMLALKSPYASAASTPAEVIAAVVTLEPPRPSAVAPDAAKADLRGDLDGIVMKALAKKPEDRYGSVERFSEDLRRYLDGLPVTAIEGSRTYIARKFVRRHRMAVASLALILLSLIGGLAGTLWQARAANRERALAEDRFSDARKLANYLLFPLYDSVQALPGSLPVRAGMATESLLYLDRLAEAKSNNAALELELAEGYLRLGAILEAPDNGADSLGNARKALDADRKALGILDSLSDRAQSGTEVQQARARANLQLGTVLNLAGQPDAGAASLSQSAQAFERLASAEPRDPARQVDVGNVYIALMDVLSARGGGFVEAATKDEVLAAAEKAVAHFNAALTIAPGEPRALRGLATAYDTKGKLDAATGQVSAAMTDFGKGLDALKRLPQDARATEAVEGLEARLETMVGYCQGELGQVPAALATLKPAQEVLDRLAQVDPQNATTAMRRVNLYRTRAAIQENAGHKTEAIADYRETVAILDGVVKTDPSKQSNRLVRAETETRLAKLLVENNQLAEATGYARAGVGYLDEIAERPDAAPQNLNEAALAHLDAPIPALVDNARAARYALRADQLAKGKDPIAIFYLAQAYENLMDGPKALAAIERLGVLIPPPAPGNPVSHRRLLVEKHLRRIQALIKTGHLPADSN